MSEKLLKLETFNEFINRFKIIELTLPNTSTAYYDIPEGCNGANTICLGCVFKNSNGTWYNTQDVLPVYVGRLSVGSNYFGKECKVILYKFN